MLPFWELWFPEMAQNCIPHTKCSVCKVFPNNAHYMSQLGEAGICN